MTTHKTRLVTERSLYGLTRRCGQTISYYKIESSSQDLETGESTLVTVSGSARFVLVHAIASQLQLLKSNSLITAEQYFVYLDRDADFTPTEQSFVYWDNKFWVIVKIQKIDGGTILACNTCQNLSISRVLHVSLTQAIEVAADVG